MITIEEINGKKCTVVWYTNIYSYIAERDNLQLLQNGEIVISDLAFEHIATALPALPPYPKPEDAPLLYRYMAERIIPCNERELRFVGLSSSGWVCSGGYHCFIDYPITHATQNGQRVEIAIEEVI